MVAGTIPSELGKLVQLTILYSQPLVSPSPTHLIESVATHSLQLPFRTSMRASRLHCCEIVPLMHDCVSCIRNVKITGTLAESLKNLVELREL